MDHAEIARYWDGNAETWTRLVRAGYDVYRDHVNTPAFLAMLPDIAGLAGLDIGCGEGYNTRLLARRGARMTAVDISPTFIRHAVAAETAEPLGIDYREADAGALPFDDEAFDFATSFMSLMDMSAQDRAFREAHRVLRPGSFLQFSILHPCFVPPYRKPLRTADGADYAVEVGRYFDNVDGEIESWTFNAAPKEIRSAVALFQTPRFHRTLSEWLNMAIGAGFIIERCGEPRANEETAKRIPHVADTRVAPIFLHLRCRKPSR